MSSVQTMKDYIDKFGQPELRELAQLVVQSATPSQQHDLLQEIKWCVDNQATIKMYDVCRQVGLLVELQINGNVRLHKGPTINIWGNGLAHALSVLLGMFEEDRFSEVFRNEASRYIRLDKARMKLLGGESESNQTSALLSVIKDTWTVPSKCPDGENHDWLKSWPTGRLIGASIQWSCSRCPAQTPLLPSGTPAPTPREP